MENTKEKVANLMGSSNFVPRFKIVGNIKEAEFLKFVEDYDLIPVYDKIRGIILFTKGEKTLSGNEIKNLKPCSNT